MPRTLFVTAGPPLPAERGARVRDLALFTRVGARRRASLLALVGSQRDADGLGPLRDRMEPVDAVVVPERPRAPARLRPRGPRVPIACLPYLDPVAIAAVRDAIREQAPDVVQLEHWLLAPLIDAVPLRGRPAFVASLHNVGSGQYSAMSRAAGAAGRPLAALKSGLVRRVERRHLPGFDGVLVVSEQDRRRLAGVVPGVEADVVPNGVDCTALRPLPGGGEDGAVLMVANYGYRPNLDGARWLCREVLPELSRLEPGVRVRLLGPGGGRALEELGALPAVEAIGPVPDTEPHYAAARVAVAPLHAGGGTRLKVLEAMALGRPVVSTSVGCEGLGLRPGEHLLVADDPRGFAEAVADLLDSPGRRGRIAAAARAEAERAHDWDASARALLRAHDRALERAQERNRRAATE